MRKRNHIVITAEFWYTVKGNEKNTVTTYDIRENKVFGSADIKNLLSVKDAAGQVGMTETEFCKKAGLTIQQ